MIVLSLVLSACLPELGKEGTNAAPSGLITAPETDKVFIWKNYDDGDNHTVITFTGTGKDSEDGELTGDSLRWTTREANGASTWQDLGTGSEVDVIHDITVGRQAYDIRLTIVDSEEKKSIRTLTFFIVGPED